MAKRLGWTMVIGGALGLLAQILFDIWSALCTDPNFFLSEILGSDVLVSMGIIGGVLGGLGIYRHLSARSMFGAGLPFSGFAFGIGEHMMHGWTKENPDSFWKCTWSGLWMVIWFNVLVFALSFFIAGIFYYCLGIHDASQFAWVQPLAEPTTGIVRYICAFFFAGVVCSVWEIVIVVTKLSMVKVLAIAWCVGCLLTPTGIMAWLGSVAGWGPDVMVMNGGQIIYNTAFMFFNGVEIAGFEFAVLCGTIGCLFLTAWLCFIIHAIKFGHKPQNYKDEVKGEKAEAVEAPVAEAVSETVVVAEE